MLLTPTPTELGNSMPLLLAPLEPLRPSPAGNGGYPEIAR